MHVSDLDMEDYFKLPNALADGPEVDATASFDVVWSGPVTRRLNVQDGSNGNQFAGEYVEDQATVTWSGSNELGFRFTANPGDFSTSVPVRAFAELGHERNGIFFPGGDPVLAAGRPQHPVGQALTPQQLRPVVQQAIADWQAAGATAAQTAALRQAPVHISALPGSHLGEEAANQVWISPNAAGWGWYTGASPPAPSSERMDLRSVVDHEFGHVLGLDDSDNLQDVMGETLSPGVRRLPTAGDLPGAAHAAPPDALLVRALGPAGAPALGGGSVQPAPSGRGTDAVMAAPADSGRAVQLVPATAVTAGPARHGVRDQVFADLDGGFVAALGIFTVPAWPL
jgi:hypothetical protein